MRTSPLHGLTLLAAIAMLGGCIGRTAGYTAAQESTARRLDGIELRSVALDGETEVPDAWYKEPLSSGRVARWSVWRHPAVQEAFADLGIARAQLAGALRLPNPQLHSSFSWAGADDDPTVEIDLTMSLTALVNIANRERAGQRAMDVGKALVVRRAVAVSYAARRGFVEAVAAEHALSVQKKNLAAAVASAAAAKELLDVGNIARLVWVNEQAMVEELRVMVSDAQANTQLRRQALAAALGLTAGEVLPPLPKQLEAMPEAADDMKRLATLANEQSLDLAIVESQYAAAAARADAATLQAYLPHLEAGAAIRREGGGWGFGPVVGFGIPLFDQGQGPIGVAEAQMSRAQAVHRRINIELDRAVKGAVTRLAVRRAQVAHFQERLLPLRASVLDETLLQYNAMSLGVFQVLQARRDQLRAQVAFIGVLRGYWSAKYDLEQLSKGSLPPSSGAMQSGAMSEGGGASSAGH